MTREIFCDTTHVTLARTHSFKIKLYLVVVILCFLSFDLFAASDPLTRGLEGFVSWAKSGLGIAFASAVLIAIGVAWAFNKIHFAWVLGYCVGMGFIFGGQAIVTTIKGWIS